jgi:hypothetical protein
MISILLDVCELDRLGILACRKPSSRDYETLADWADVVPDRLVLTYLGSIYYQIMGLEDIPVKDILEVAEFINR